MFVYRMVRSFWLLACVSMLSLTGCGEAVPEAPELRDAPVYENAQEGFRFMVPDGWTQTASSVLPPGEIQGEAFLARYRVKSPEAGSMLVIECSAASNEKSLKDHHAASSYRANQWTLKGQPETLKLGGREARRMMFEATLDGRVIAKEVTCFQKGNRLYSFVGLFSSTDEKARQQIQRAISSVVWD